MREEFKLINSQKGLKDLNVALDRIAVSWGLPQKVMLEINLMLEELLANVIEHVEGPNRFMGVQLSSDETYITIRIEDDGPPFNLLDSPAAEIGLPMESRQEGGLGLHFVKHFSDELSYSRENDKNIVNITRKIERDDQGDI